MVVQSPQYFISGLFKWQYALYLLICGIDPLNVFGEVSTRIFMNKLVTGHTLSVDLRLVSSPSIA